MKTLRVGSKVAWASHGQGVFTIKKGKVVAIVEAGEDARRIVAGRSDLSYDAVSTRMCGGVGGDSRDHTSYLVLVPSGGTQKPRLYWPRVSHLQVVKR